MLRRNLKKLLFLAIILALNFNLILWAAPDGESLNPNTVASSPLPLSQGVLTAIPSFAPVAEKAADAVVNISVVKKIKVNFGRGGNNPFPFEDRLFEDFFGLPRGETPFGGGDGYREKESKGSGTGFIVDPKGYILTNNHVVSGADEIMVKLTNGKEFKAEVLGTDVKTDLALIKISEEGIYPYLVLGDSEKMRIGDWVVAIGNPFGLEHTVTSGILSARGRALGAGPYDDFLQTDASINPGNSGGPLLNLEGDVIGINTAIIAGGNGIGFAIPSNLAKGIVTQLKDKGRVVRGWMGVIIQEVTPEIATMFSLKEAYGALVSDIDTAGPGVEAKIQRGDIILTFDGKKVKDWQSLPLLVAETEINKKIKIVVWRDKKELTLDLVVSELKDDVVAEVASEKVINKIGLFVKELTPEMAKKLNSDETGGVYVSGIDQNSLAATGGFMVGDLILEVNKIKMLSIEDYNKIVSEIKDGDNVLFLIKRDARTMYIMLNIPK